MVAQQGEAQQETEAAVAGAVDITLTVDQVDQVLFTLNMQVLKEELVDRILQSVDFPFILLHLQEHTQHEPLCKSRKRFCDRSYCCRARLH
jgi:hypothetical protein